jgi:hypothetical protein
VTNNPINMTDPSGEIAPLIWAGINTIWDLGNVAYDAYTCNQAALALDLVALQNPLVPGGAGFAMGMLGKSGKLVTKNDNLLSLSEHAIERMAQRGITTKDVQKTLSAVEPFNYYHDGVWKNGYYDPTSQLFIGEAGGKITTVINEATQTYIDNLKGMKP